MIRRTAPRFEGVDRSLHECQRSKQISLLKNIGNVPFAMFVNPCAFSILQRKCRQTMSSFSCATSRPAHRKVSELFDVWMTLENAVKTHQLWETWVALGNIKKLPVTFTIVEDNLNHTIAVRHGRSAGTSTCMLCFTPFREVSTCATAKVGLQLYLRGLVASEDFVEQLRHVVAAELAGMNFIGVPLRKVRLLCMCVAPGESDRNNRYVLFVSNRAVPVSQTLLHCLVCVIGHIDVVSVFVAHVMNSLVRAPIASTLS